MMNVYEFVTGVFLLLHRNLFRQFGTSVTFHSFACKLPGRAANIKA